MLRELAESATVI